MKQCIKCGEETRSRNKYCSECNPFKKLNLAPKLYNYIRRLKLKKKALDINGSCKCILCNQENIYLLEFHHVYDKDFQICDKIYNSGINKDFSQELISEIKKCIVLCKKCHILQHPELRSSNEDKKLELYKYSGGECKDCGEDNILFMHWHHLNPLTKKFEIGRGIKDGRSIKSLKEEVDKCDMLCTHCHILRFKKEYEERIGYNGY